MHSQDTQCLYALIEGEPKKDQVQTAKKMTKIYLRITAEPHALIQTLTKNMQSFKKICLKLKEVLCSQATHRKTLVEVEPKMTKFKLQKVTKLI